MNKFKNILLICGVLFLASCQGLVDDLNNDPNNFTDTPLTLILNHTMLNVASVAEAEGARITSIFADQFTGVDRQYGTLNNYSTVSADYNAFWEDVYQRGIAQAQIAKQKAQDIGASTEEGIATILEAYYFGEAALLFGDVPFSQVNQIATFPDPTFESQKTVLEGAIALLDEGLSKAGAKSANNSVFGTTSTWSGIANGLKARYHLALKNYDMALEAANAAGFVGESQSWNIKHGTANFAENLFWQFEVEQRAGYLQVDSSYMWSMLDAASTVYKGNSKTDETARRDYYSADGVALNTTNGFAAQTASFSVLSYSEVQLIAAEAALEGSTPDMSAALTALNNVRARNASVFNSKYDAYDMADFEVGGMLNNGGSVKDAMKMEILKEKYVSVIGLPTFQDVNRTKNLIGVPVKGGGASIIPQRFLYPQAELSSNSNAPKLVDQYVPTPVNM